MRLLRGRPRAGARARAEDATARAGSRRAPLTFAPPPAADASAGKKGGKAAKEDLEATVKERIAPRKRAPTEDTLGSPADFAEEPALSRRDLPRPRGRFTRVEAPRASFMELTRLTGKPVVEAAMEAADHRFALLRALSQRFNGARGELTQVDLENVLRDHGLMDAMVEKERRRCWTASPPSGAPPAAWPGPWA
ncbi:hypothetical protein QEG98_19775 [Myxococcus sp. MxC21-1]|uniref:hypothetical protein n=1 Tax=Myxococcus sp. MxC21-1 TaxID=3041439 RepID=UPI00292DF0D6|nr:hypothetical protein [Myxococcus sp. MxC21-1]WNZ65649.1 hypothetical protein QEG98_19775 [Myxococcus sp. MxC21-1]